MMDDASAVFGEAVRTLPLTGRAPFQSGVDVLGFPAYLRNAPFAISNVDGKPTPAVPSSSMVDLGFEEEFLRGVAARDENPLGGGFSLPMDMPAVDEEVLAAVAEAGAEAGMAAQAEAEAHARAKPSTTPQKRPSSGGPRKARRIPRVMTDERRVQNREGQRRYRERQNAERERLEQINAALRARLIDMQKVEEMANRFRDMLVHMQYPR